MQQYIVLYALPQTQHYLSHVLQFALCNVYILHILHSFIKLCLLWSCSVNSSQLLPGVTTQSCGWLAQQLHSTWFPSPLTHISPPSAFTIQRWSSRDQSFTLMTKNFYLSSRVLVWDVYEANGMCLEDMEPPFLASLKSWAQTEIYIDKHWHN